MVFDQLCGIERVFRLNPHWTVERFVISPGPRLQAGSRIEAEIEDYATGEVYRLDGECTCFEPPRTMVLEYGDSPKRGTKFFVGEVDGGSRITVEETYGEEEEDDRLQWHRQQLEFWVRSIVAYLRLQARPGIRAAITRWFMNRFWIPATPSGRRISIFVLKISLVEIVIIVAMVAAWALFTYRRP